MVYYFLDVCKVVSEVVCVLKKDGCFFLIDYYVFEDFGFDEFVNYVNWFCDFFYVWESLLLEW